MRTWTVYVVKSRAVVGGEIYAVYDKQGMLKPMWSSTIKTVALIGTKSTSKVMRCVNMEPELIAYLATLGYEITIITPDCYECYNTDSTGMTEEQQRHMQQATAQWLVRKYYH